jgi:N-glycosylase/DNA lyase
MSQNLDGNSKPQVSQKGSIPAQDFNLGLSMNCGQIFGWDWDGDWCWGVIGGVPVGLRQRGPEVDYIAGAGLTPERISVYLGLDEDYRRIIRSISVDGFMKRAVASARGLRVLKQERWPCLGSYILSSNNRVERIQYLVRQISMKMGEAHGLEGRQIYAFPHPEALGACHEREIRSCGAGFRSPYLNEAARMVASREVDLEDVMDMPYAGAKDALKRLPGVGEKVADCVLLFAFSRYEAFPVDVWIKRAVERVYFKGRDLKVREIHEFARSHFGPYAGYAQEYIYQYARQGGLK